MGVVHLSPPPDLSLAGCTPAEPTTLSAWQARYRAFSRFLSNTEIFQDLLNAGQSAAARDQEPLRRRANLKWFTRSPHFFPMQTDPAAFELSSPDYRRHFYGLPPALKEFILTIPYQNIRPTPTTT